TSCTATSLPARRTCRPTTTVRRSRWVSATGNVSWPCVAGRKRARRQRSIRPPTDVWSIACSVQAASPNQTEVQKASSESGQPETECIEPRERHVTSPNHQRHEVVRKPEHNWHDHEEN